MGFTTRISATLALLLLALVCGVNAGSHQQGKFATPPVSKKRGSHHSSHTVRTRSRPGDWMVDRFPYMCNILKRGSRGHVCSGFLIRPEWVITAASCVDPKIHMLGSYPLVYCGAYGKEEGSKTGLFTGKGIIHPNWTGDHTKGFDIAVVKLNKEAQLSFPEINKNPIPLPSGTLLSVLGWARETSSATYGLQIATGLSYIEQDACQKLVSFKVRDHMICVRQNKKSALEGEIGAPLLIPDQAEHIVDGLAEFDFVLGIASGSSPSSPDSTVIHTSIGHFWGWIEHVIDGKPLPSKTGSKGPASSTKTEAEGGDASRKIKKDKTERSFSAKAPPVEEQKTVPKKKHASKDTSSTVTKPQGTPYADLSGEKLESVLEAVSKNIKNDNVKALRTYLTGGLDPDSVYGTSEETLLHLAVRSNALKSMKALLDSGAKVDARNKNMETPLHIASSNGHLSAVKILLTHGAEIDAFDRKGNTPMIRACQQFLWSIAEFLISKGANIDARSSSYQWTAMHYGARYGEIDMITFLIANGAKPDEKDVDGWTPLFTASRYAGEGDGNNAVAIVKALLAAGASKLSRSRGGNRPYDVICWTGHCPSATKKFLQDLLDPKTLAAQ